MTKLQSYKVRLLSILEKMENSTFLNTGIATNAGEEKLLHALLIATAKGDRLISTRIADKIGLTRSAVSQMVTKLEERGVVQRVAAENDKKIAYIEFTEKTADLIAEQDERCSKFFKSAINELGEDSLEKMFEMFEELLEKVGEERNP